MRDDQNLETKIKEIINQKEVLPESVKAKTNRAYEEIRTMNRKRKKTHKKKWIAAAAILVIGTVSVQTPLFAEMKALLFGGSYRGVQTAIEQGNLQKIEGVVSESNGIKLEVVGALIDPTVIHLRLKLTAQNSKILKDFRYDKQHTSSFIDQFDVIDDQGRVIQKVDEEGTYTIPIKDATGKELWLLSSSTDEVNTSRLEQGEIYIDMIFNSSEGNYRGITGLTLQTKQVGSLKGDWMLEMPFTSEMIESKEVIYEVSRPNSKIDIASAVAHRTGLQIDFTTKVPVDESIISNTKIISEEGSVYTSGRAGWMEGNPEGERVVLTFEVLEEELGENFTLKIQNLNGVDESVMLTRESK